MFFFVLPCVTQTEVWCQARWKVGLFLSKHSKRSRNTHHAESECSRPAEFRTFQVDRKECDNEGMKHAHVRRHMHTLV